MKILIEWFSLFLEGLIAFTVDSFSDISVELGTLIILELSECDCERQYERNCKRECKCESDYECDCENQCDRKCKRECKCERECDCGCEHERDCESWCKCD